MFERIMHIARKEFRQIFRDRMMRFLIFLPPIVDMLIFGYAASLDVNSVRTAILDQDRTVISRDLVERFTRTGYFDVIGYLDSPDQADLLVDRGEVGVFICIKKGFERSVKNGEPADIFIVVDGTDSSNASVVMGYINTILNSYSERVLTEKIGLLRGRDQTAPVGINRVNVITRTWYNEELKSRNFFIPGIIGSILTVLGIMLSSMSIVKEREMGTMEQLNVTPIKPIELIIGKLAPLTAIAYFDVCMVTIIATAWFGVPFAGSVITLFIGVTFFFFANLGYGVLISTVSATQQQAMMNTFIYTFPAMLLSGFVFPIESMPKVIVPFTYFNPMRYVTEVLRGVFLKGMGIGDLWPELLGMFVLGMVALGVSAVRFRKRIV